MIQLKFPFFIVLLLSAFHAFSDVVQDHPVDSLRAALKVYEASGEVRNLVVTHDALAWEYRDNRPDSALYHANIALKLSKEFDFQELEIQSMNYVGVAYRNLSNFSKAFEKYLEALRLSEERDNGEQRGYSLINLGNLYLYQTNFQGAIKYFIQALDQAQTLANRRMVAYCFLNLGRSYRGISEYGQAALYFKQAIDLRTQLGDVYGRNAAEIDLAEVYMLQGDLQKSETFYLEVIQELSSDENSRLLAVTYNNLSKIYLARNNISKAEYYSHAALKITQRVNSRYEERNVLESLSNVHASGGDYKQAYEDHILYAELNHQLFSEENIRKIEQLKGQYEMEKQEAENEFLRRKSELSAQIINRQRIIITLSVLGILLVFSVAIISIRAYVIKKRLSSEVQLQRDKIMADKEVIEHQSARLADLDEAKSRFFANLSHDLRSPLSLIIGNLDMLKDDDGVILTTGAIRNLETARKNCKRLLYLTDEINDLTKLAEGKINLRREVVKLGSYLEMLTEMFIGTAEYKGVKLTFSSQLDKNECFLIDPRQFEKIFYNLVSNAIRHTSRGDRITIECINDQAEIFINIVDTGDGIPSESLPYVFNRFYQSKNNEYRAREGLGIGLALVKELVELHDGKIIVESAVGVGTAFRMTFPKGSPMSNNHEISPTFSYVAERKHLYDEIDREDRAGVGIPKNDESRETIMVVDDHPEIRYHIRQILEDDFHIIEAAHGVEALELLKHNDVQLIISDLMMPWMDGFELIESLKNSEEFSRIPVLVVSARISDSDQEKVLYTGINDYLQKPFQKKELVLRINNLLNARKSHEQSEEYVLSPVFEKANLDTVEKDILVKLERTVMERIDDESLSVYDLADVMAASERQVYRLVKKITGLTPFEYVSEIRMKYADLLIRKGKVKNASEAARSIGIKNVTVFSRQYEKKFGVKPSEILKA